MGKAYRSETERQLAAAYDAFHTARASTTLVAQLYAEAMGDAYPHELNASGTCDWPLLGTAVGRLRMRPDQLLVDLGCGTGGVGLWLARALAVSLVGIDISARAVDLAGDRVARFVAPGRAEFQVGTLEATGLPEARADGAVCIDALAFAPHRLNALTEIRRILRPGARIVITSGVRRTHSIAPTWPEQAAAAGLELESEEERPEEPAMLHRLYRLWVEREADLRRELGDQQAQNMLDEARRRSRNLGNRRAVVVTLKRPVDEDPPHTTP
ncbi:class I SAM-dependent methyltransferase [Streptomyces syringium]|uniref:class I SAM-dependent methyltransferase n=1 Tax=Streptomyces syringium TaxID=76729 RepID=UPI0037D3B5C1